MGEVFIGCILSMPSVNVMSLPGALVSVPVLESYNNPEAEVALQGSCDVCIMNIITANCPPQKNT